MSGLGAPPTILGLLGHPQTLRNWTTHGLHRFRVSNLNLLEIYSKNVSLTSWFGVSEAVQYKWTSNSQYSILRGLETESAKSSLGFPNDLIEGHRFEKMSKFFFFNINKKNIGMDWIYIFKEWGRVAADWFRDMAKLWITPIVVSTTHTYWQAPQIV